MTGHALASPKRRKELYDQDCSMLGLINEQLLNINHMPARTKDEVRIMEAWLEALKKGQEQTLGAMRRHLDWEKTR